MKNRFYYSIYELMSDELKASHDTGYILRQNFSDESSEGLWGLLKALVDEEDALGSDDEFTRELWCKYLWPKIYDKKITYLDINAPRWEEVEPTSEQLEKLTKDLVAEMSLWLEETYDEYVAKLQYYWGRVDSLDADITTSVFNRFNDTPQAASTDIGGFDNDNYATTTNKTVSSTMGGTPVQRLNEIMGFIQDLYQQWADDFVEKFVILGVE